MIRDKRKVSPSTGAGDKPADANESKDANGSEAAASEPAAQDGATGDKATGEKTAADKATEDRATGDKPGQDRSATAAAAKDASAAPATKLKPAGEKAAEEKAAPSEAAAAKDSAEVGELRSALDERTADLQRITAEYANYRKRVERDRAMAGELAVGMVLTELLAVLDDIDRARDHGDLTGPFAAVADKLTTVTSKFGLTAFGAKGDPFDPNRHEAVAHQTSSEVTEPTCIDVMRRGYLLGERLLRPALVAVADPESE